MVNLDPINRRTNISTVTVTGSFSSSPPTITLTNSLGASNVKVVRDGSSNLFKSVLNLSPGDNVVLITDDTGYRDTFVLTLEASKPLFVTPDPILEANVALLNIRRKKGESPFSLKKWAVLSTNEYRRSSSSLGLYNAFLVSERKPLLKNSSLRITSPHRFKIHFTLDSIIILGPQLVEEKWVGRSGLKLEENKKFLRTATSYPDLKYDSMGNPYSDSNQKIKFNYSLEIPKRENLGVFVQVLESLGFKVDVLDSLKSNTCQIIVPSSYFGENIGNNFFCECPLSSVPVPIYTLSNKSFQREIFDNRTPGTLGFTEGQSYIQKIIETIPSTLANLNSKNFMFSEETGADRLVGLPIHYDVFPTPQNCLSGTSISRKFRLSKDGMEVYLGAGEVIFGNVAYRRFLSKDTRHLPELAECTWRIDTLVHYNPISNSSTGVVGDALHNGNVESWRNLSYPVQAFLNGREIPITILEVSGPIVKANLGELYKEYDNTDEIVTDGTSLLIVWFVKGFSTAATELPINKSKMVFSINSDPIVVRTKNEQI